MKTTTKIITILFLMLCVNSLKGWGQQYELSMHTDQIGLQGEVYVSGNGEVVEVPFIFYQGGVTASVLVSLIEQDINEAGLDEAITDVSVEYTMPLLEGSIYLTFSRNLGIEDREVYITSSSNSATLIQAVAESGVYNLSGNISPIWHGQEFRLRLSNSDDFAYYRLKRVSGGVTEYCDTIDHAGGQLFFTESRNGVYSAEAFYPSVVAMNGSVTVSYLSFYDKTHTFLGSSRSVNPNGEKITLPFTPAQTASLTELNTILNAYNTGLSNEWDSSMQLSYSNGVLTVLCAPNIGSWAIANNTWFKKSNGQYLSFNQSTGGRLLGQSITTQGGEILLTESQPLVNYALINTLGAVISSATGTGEALALNIPSSPGIYLIKASYKEEELLMEEAVVVTQTGAVIKRDNFILTETSLNASGTRRINDITYYDGLGRPEQIVNIASSPSGRNIVKPVWYDAVGRNDARTYLPYESLSDGMERETAALSSQQSWYSARYGNNNGGYAYSRKTYEPSPLNRVTAERRPGYDYASMDKESILGYGLNNVSDSVLRILPTSPGSGGSGAGEICGILIRGYYAAKMLQKQTTTDEDGMKVTTFTDNSGNVVLSRTDIGSGRHSDTYYVYDGSGRLCWVITPEGSALLYSTISSGRFFIWGADATEASQYAYRYGYDGLGRCTVKWKPGVEVEYTVYDASGRAVAIQDGNLRDRGNRWILMRYNAFGEVTEQYLTGTFLWADLVEAFSGTDAYPQSVYGAAGNVLMLQRQYGGTRPQGSPAFFTETGFVTQDSLVTNNTGRVVWERIYDTEDVYAVACGTMSSGNAAYAERSFFYDQRGVMRQSVERDPYGGVLTESVLPDYMGNVLNSRTRYTIGAKSYVLNTGNTFDNRSRLLMSTTSTQGGTTAVAYSYDALGRRNKSKFGGSIVQQGSPIMSRTDSLNIQGQLTETLATLVNGTNVYSQTLRYYNPEKAGTTARWNGFISEINQRQGTNLQDTYGYSYDAGGRLVDTWRYHGSSASGDGMYTERGMNYNLNSALLRLQRYGAVAAVAEDSLAYWYNGMKLSSVTGRHAGNAINASYQYDGSGNMTIDGLNGYAISYDILNGTSQLSSISGTDIVAEYRRMADGLRYISTASDGTGLLYRGALVLSYEGKTGQQLSGVHLMRAAAGSGEAALIVAENSAQETAAPYYYVYDHLGSVRAVVDGDGTVVERNDYYPYGSRHTTGHNYPEQDGSYLRFGGKEDQGAALGRSSGATASASLHLLDFGARMYDPVVCQWTTTDPLSEKYYSISPYAYCAGNPVNLVDPNGEDWYINNETGYYTWFDGNEDKEGYTYYGTKGSILGEAEDMMDYVFRTIISKNKEDDPLYTGPKSIYTNGFSFAIRDKDTQALFGGNDTFGLFEEFVNETGPEVSVFTQDHPYTRDMMKTSFVKSKQSQLEASKETMVEDVRKWSVWDVFTKESMAEQFIGSYNYYGKKSPGGSFIYNMIYDSKNAHSLFLHLPYVVNYSRNIVGKYGNTYQFYMSVSLVNKK